MAVCPNSFVLVLIDILFHPSQVLWLVSFNPASSIDYIPVQIRDLLLEIINNILLTCIFFNT